MYRKIERGYSLNKKNLGLALFAFVIVCCVNVVPVIANETGLEPVDTSDVNMSERNKEQSIQNGWQDDGTYWVNGTQYKSGMYSIDGNNFYFDDNGYVLKNNWLVLNNKTYFFDNNGYMVKSCVYTINCHYYSFNEDGSLQKNVAHYDNMNRLDMWFGDDGKAIESQWIEIDGKQYYCKSDGYIARNSYHIQIDEDYYCFDTEGQVLKDYVYCVANYTYIFGSDGKAIRNDWVSLYGEKSYCDDTGLVVKNKIKEIDNEVYSFDSDGKIMKNCEHSNYYFGKDGKALKNKWIKTEEGLKYFGDDGYLYKEPKIYYIDGYKYAFNSNGIMLTGWQQPYLNAFARNDNWYCFDSNGHLLTYQWIDDYYVDESGKRITDQNYKINDDLYHFDYSGKIMRDYVYSSYNSVYYFDEDGKAIKNQWRNTSEGRQYYGDNYLLYKEPGMHEINGKLYTFDENGIMLTGWQQPYKRKEYSPSDLWYLFDTTGAKVTKGQWYEGYYADEYGMRVLNKLYQIEEYYYLFDEEGKPRINYLYQTGIYGTQYFGADGKQYINKWLDTPKGKMYFGSDGKAYCGMHKVGDNTYFFDSEGYMQTGWQQDHYYNDDGAMAKNQWIGDAYVDENGNQLKSELKNINDCLYYFDSYGLLKRDFEYKHYYFGLDGKAFKNQWRETENGWMYYDTNSNYCTNDLIHIGDYTYSFSDDGIRCTGWKSFYTSNTYVEWSYFDSEGRMLKNQWIGDYYVDYSGVRVENKTYYLDGSTYLFDENGRVKKNYLYQNQMYFGEDGRACRNQWLLTNNGLMYFSSDEYCCNNPGSLVVIDGNTYTFDKNGYILTGWQQLENEYYYFDQSGKMIRNAWQGNYYLQENGVMAKDCWIGDYYVDCFGVRVENKIYYLDGSTYLFDENGHIKKNYLYQNQMYFGEDGKAYRNQWLLTNNGLMYFSSDERCCNNPGSLVDIDGNTYTFDKNGHMLTGWQQLENEYYYFNQSGKMIKNAWQGNYYLQENGVMAKDCWIGSRYVNSNGLWTPSEWMQTNGKWWLRYGDGTFAKNNFETISGQTYYFDGNGYMVTGWKKINNKDYFFNDSGFMVKDAWQGAYYLGSDGVMLTNTFTKDGYYVGANGAYYTNRWFKDQGKAYYVNGSGKLVKNAWQGAYYLGKDGVMLTNAFTPDGFYVGADGAYVRNQKITVEGKDYYLNAYGKVAKNQWAGDYYLDGNGNVTKNQWAGSYWCGEDGKYVKNAWVDNNKSYVNENGVYVTNQWIGDYYVNGSGVKVTNAWVGSYWCESDGKYAKSKWVDNDKSYVNQYGNYVTNQWIGDYYLNGSGVKVTNTWVGNYWCGSDGKYVKSSWVDNNRYYVNENGVYVEGAWQQDSKGWKYHAGNVYAKDITLNINGTSYTFDSNGYMK